MPKALRLFGATVALFVCGAIFSYSQTPSAGKTTQAARTEHVILISVDGMPPDYYTAPEKLGLRAPRTVARKAGLTTAAVGWPVTVGAEIDYNVPEIYDPSESPATWNWTAKHSTPGLLEKALGPDLKKGSSVDERLTSVSEFIIKNHRPNLPLLHLIELDGAHHRNGPRTKPGIETAEREDGYIRRQRHADGAGSG